MADPVTLSVNCDSDLWTRLRLSEDDLSALANQGFITSEYRLRDGQKFGPYFKLRFRKDGRQHVRYLGRDARLAAQVDAALASLQAPVCLAREAASLMAEVRQQLRRAKEKMKPHLTDLGFHYHGYVARRPRNSRASTGAEKNRRPEGLIGISFTCAREATTMNDKTTDRSANQQCRTPHSPWRTLPLGPTSANN